MHITNIKNNYSIFLKNEWVMDGQSWPSKKFFKKPLIFIFFGVNKKYWIVRDYDQEWNSII